MRYLEPDLRWGFTASICGGSTRVLLTRYGVRRCSRSVIWAGVHRRGSTRLLVMPYGIHSCSRSVATRARVYRRGRFRVLLCGNSSGRASRSSARLVVRIRHNSCCTPHWGRKKSRRGAHGIVRIGHASWCTRLGRNR
ncbi:unnamed protein product [Ectocarpus sp. 12 AP-2014]